MERTGPDQGLIILTCSQWLNYEGRRSTWSSRRHIEGAIRPCLTTDDSSDLGVDFTEGGSCDWQLSTRTVRNGMNIEKTKVKTGEKSGDFLFGDLIDTNRNIEKVGVLPIRIGKSNVSSVGLHTERNVYCSNAPCDL